MQQRIWIALLGQHIEERVCLGGWLHRLRRLGSVSFLLLRDKTGIAQIVIEDRALLESLGNCGNESVLMVEGRVVAESQAPAGVEIHEPVIRVLSCVETPPPFELFRPIVTAQLPTLLDHAAVALRHPRQQAIFRLSSAAMSGFRSTLHWQA